LQTMAEADIGLGIVRVEEYAMRNADCVSRESC
jgi:hypothetical protein